MAIDDYVGDIKTHPTEYKRQTGRTTRMMMEAVTAANAGRHAVVLFKDPEQVTIWQEKFGPILRLSIESMPEELSSEVNWADMKLRGNRAGHVLFVDHHIFEVFFSHILQNWIRYDQPLDHTPFNPVT